MPWRRWRAPASAGCRSSRAAISASSASSRAPMFSQPRRNGYSRAMHPPERRPRVPLLVQLLIATLLGALTGRLLGPRASWLGQAALVFIDTLKLLATPLVFVAIVDTFVTTRLPLRRALVLLPLSAVNAVVAAGIAIGLAHALPLARMVDL